MDHYKLLKKWRIAKEKNEKLREKNQDLQDALQKEKNKKHKKIIKKLLMKIEQKNSFIEEIKSEILALVQGSFIPYRVYKTLFDASRLDVVDSNGETGNKLRRIR